MRNLIKTLKDKQMVILILYLCMAVGIVAHIVPYFYNRSLWIDEAMLVSSICTRPLTALFSSPLDWGQSAPVGWLFIEKVLTMLFGQSETVLRVWSLLTCFGCAIVMYRLMYGKIQKCYALFFTTLFLLTDRYIYYGNEAKSYMSDNFCSILTLFLWQKHKEGKIALAPLVISYAILVWCSFAAIFFIAACMIIECWSLFRSWVKEINFKKYIGKFSLCSVVLISFISNYLFWLSRTASNAGGGAYWRLLRFPLIPKSVGDIKLAGVMAKQFTAFYPHSMVLIICAMFAVYVYMAIKEKKDSSLILAPYLLSLFIVLAVSYLGFYPIQDRLVQTYPLIVFIFCGFMCDKVDFSSLLLYEKNTALKSNAQSMLIFFYGLLACMLVLTASGGYQNLSANHVYKGGSEVSKSMEYLKQHLNSKDVIYIAGSAQPVFVYETGYETTFDDLKNMKKPYQIDNKIWGSGLFRSDFKEAYSYKGRADMKAVKREADFINRNQSVYLFFSHNFENVGGGNELLRTLRNTGTVTTVVKFHNTYLYHYVKGTK